MLMIQPTHTGVCATARMPRSCTGEESRFRAVWRYGQGNLRIAGVNPADLALQVDPGG